MNAPSDIRIKYHHSKNGLTALDVMMPLKSCWNFKLIKESYLPKIFKQLHLLREIQIGHPEWDDEVYVEGDEPAIKDLFVTYPELQGLVLEVLKADYVFQLTPNTIKISTTAHELNKSEKELAGSAFIRALHEILLRAVQRPVVPRTKDQTWIFNLFMAFIAFLGAASLYLTITLDDHDTVLLKHDLALFGSVIGIALSPIPLICWRLIRKLHSRSHYEFMTFFIVCSISFMMIGIFGSLYLNREWDRGPSYESVAKFESKKITKNKHGYNYFISFRVVKPAEITNVHHVRNLVLRVPSQIFSEATPGSEVPLEFKQGYFGYPWYRFGGINHSSLK